MMKPVTKYSVEINSPGSTGEVVTNAFRAAMTPRAGAAFIAFPQDVQRAQAQVEAPSLLQLPLLGAAPSLIEQAAGRISGAKQQVLLLGMGASEPGATAGVRRLLKQYPLPVLGTFQGAGAVLDTLLRTRWAFPQPTRRQTIREG